MNLDTIISIIEFILALGTIILLHEFGHFIVGRLCKIDVEEFGIGYPPRLFKLFTWKGTLFTLNWIPFGGFCRFKGEEDPENNGGLAGANKWAKLGTFLGGPFMNLIFASVLFAFVISQIGSPQTNIIEVKEVVSGSPAAFAGLSAGDIILEANSQKIISADLLTTITHQNLGKEITLLIGHSDQQVKIQITPRINPPEGEGPMGVTLGYPIQTINFFQAVPNGLQTTAQIGEQLLMLPIMLIRGQVDTSQARLISPLGIYDIYAQVRTEGTQFPNYDPKIGFLNIVSFFGMISAALGFSNLLPIPALDGGHILFVLPEIFLNKKVPAKFENMVQSIGFTVLLVIMAYVFIQDFINPVILPK